MSIQKLENLVSELSKSIDKNHIVNESISKVNIGWHIEHAYIAIIKIISALKESNPEEYKRKFSFIKTLIYLLNKMPRGKAKAPKTVLPSDNSSVDTLQQLKIKVEEKIIELKNLNKNNYFLHPFFGHLNLPETIKFLCIHTNHHLKIVNDILVK